MNKWLGKTEDELIRKNGVPTGRLELKGSTFDTYQRCGGGGSTDSEGRYSSSYGCRTATFEVRDGTIVGLSIR